ncbi:MAG TPA: protein kinase [Blastocatellia bacterium]|nr:protein kinase [Blastocatellia bacterium]
MTPERYQQIGHLFDEALERPPAERAAWLQQACGADVELYDAVERLLANHHESDEFLSRPALDVAAQMLVPELSPALAGKQISHYQILSLLGAGGMGQVYLAKDTRLGRQVALKLLPVHLMRQAEHLRRFKREALAASALNHPNILTIYEFGDEDDLPFLATELVQGETLRQRITRGGLTVAEILDFTVQIVSALDAAHEAGIIHRDMKPENVMIRRDGLVKVLDFGLAKLVEQAGEFAPNNQQSSLTQQGTILGTVAYMSPEQARGQATDARSDLFSVGVMLYEMLAGRQPFTGETVNHTIVAILEQEPPPLAVSGQMLPAELQRILKQMLAKKAEARYANAQILLADLKKLAKRLELAAEQQIAAPAALDNEAPTQIIQQQTVEQFRDDTMHVAPDDSPQLAVNLTQRPAAVKDLMPTRAATPARRKFFWLLGALLAAGLIGVPVWQTLRSRDSSIPTMSALPERNLSYFLTVQRYRNGKPYQSEFQSSGREIFEPGWQFKLNVTSPQEGFLYLLNEEPGGAYVLLFPIPSHNNGASRLVANERFQTNWYVFDEKPGAEQFRLIWAAQPVPELEALRALMNPTDKGRVSDPTQAEAVRNFLRQNSSPPLESTRDPQNKQTNVRGTGAVLVALIELEHQ